MMCSTVRALCALAVFSLCTPALNAEDAQLWDIPAYYWTYGCTPTAGMMVMGYWDAYGYGNLIPGTNSWDSNQGTIMQAMASPGHISDYATYGGVQDTKSSVKPDMSTINPSGAHPNDSLADFMGTSRSSLGMYYGATRTDQVAGGVTGYATWKGYSFAAAGTGTDMPTWNSIRTEIDQGRPLMLNVCTDYSATINHTVTVVGYRDTMGYQEVAVRDTWTTTSTPKWIRLRGLSSTYVWGIGGYYTFAPTGSRDTALQSSGVDWAAATWSSGAPGLDTFARVPMGCSLGLSGQGNVLLLNNLGSLSVTGVLRGQAIRVAESGSLSMSAGAVLDSAAVNVLGNVAQFDGNCNVAQDLRVLAGSGGLPALYNQQGGRQSVSGSVLLNSGGAYRLGGGTMSTGRIETKNGGRFEWVGGTLTTSAIVLRQFISSGAPNALAIGFDVEISDLTSGSIYGGQPLAAEPDTVVEFTGGSSITHGPEAITLPGMAVGSAIGRATYTMTSPSSRLNAQYLYVGHSGVGNFVQQAGSISGWYLTVGSLAGSKGDFEMLDGNIALELGLRVGDSGTGTMRQSGTVIANGSLYLGRLAGSQGRYEMLSGLLRAETGTIAGAGNGDFSQSGGVVSIKNDLGIAYTDPNTAGSYELIDGNLSAGRLIVGGRGIATMTQRGGTFTGGISMGFYSGGYGTYLLENGRVTASSFSMSLGSAFRQTDGNVRMNTVMFIGGLYALSGGYVSATGISLSGGGKVRQTGGIVSLNNGLNVMPTESYVLEAGSVSESTYGGGNFVQKGGTHAITTEFTADGNYDLSGGCVWSTTQYVGRSSAGRFTQSDGNNGVTGDLSIGVSRDAVYRLTGGTLTVGGTCLVGTGGLFASILDLSGGRATFARLTVAYGELRLAGGVEVEVSDKLTVGGPARLTIAPGSTIHMTGSGFENFGTDANRFLTLESLSLVFEGGPGQTDTFEVAGRDYGASVLGLDRNFTLGTLQIGGDSNVGKVMLVSLDDNQPGWVGREALYVDRLILGSGSSLDLNGLSLYYGTFVDDGGTIALSGGTLGQAPEPSTLCLLALGGMSLLRSRRRRD